VHITVVKFFFNTQKEKLSLIPCVILAQMGLVMEIFEGGNLEHKIMKRSGCLDYDTTPWEPVKPDVRRERRVSYQFNRHLSVFDVTSTQQKFLNTITGGWIVNEVMVLNGVPFSDHFRVC
jgi:hypothetical protein